MLYRCTTPFETREGAYPHTFESGTLWWVREYRQADGGYELAVLEEVSDGAFTGHLERVRLSRLREGFDTVPLRDTVTLLAGVGRQGGVLGGRAIVADPGARAAESMQTDA